MPESISDYILKKKSHYSNEDLDWVQFVHDHYQNLFDSSVVRTIDKVPHYWEHYRVEDYLHELGLDPNVAWITLMINQFSSSRDFRDVEQIRIPDMDVVRALWRSFQQYRAHVNSIRT